VVGVVRDAVNVLVMFDCVIVDIEIVLEGSSMFCEYCMIIEGSGIELVLRVYG